MTSSIIPANSGWSVGSPFPEKVKRLKVKKSL